MNKAIIIGNLGSDPELRYTTNGVAVMNAPVATNEAWMAKDGSGWKTHTEWHKTVIFGESAEHYAKKLRKGDLVAMEGYMRTRKWIDSNGLVRYTTEIVVRKTSKLNRSTTSGPATDLPKGLPDPPPVQHDEDDVPF